jgi:hypothetical protein
VYHSQVRSQLRAAVRYHLGGKLTVVYRKPLCTAVRLVPVEPRLRRRANQCLPHRILPPCGHRDLRGGGESPALPGAWLQRARLHWRRANGCSGTIETSRFQPFQAHAHHRRAVAVVGCGVGRFVQITMRLADDPILPMNYSRYTDEMLECHLWNTSVATEIVE